MAKAKFAYRIKWYTSSAESTVPTPATTTDHEADGTLIGQFRPVPHWERESLSGPRPTAEQAKQAANEAHQFGESRQIICGPTTYIAFVAK